MKCLQKLGMWRALNGGILKLCWSNIVHHLTIYLSPVEIDRLIREHTTKKHYWHFQYHCPFTNLILSTYSLKERPLISSEKSSLYKNIKVFAVFYYSSNLSNWIYFMNNFEIWSDKTPQIWILVLHQFVNPLAKKVEGC